jgi:hypothetical protein
MGIINALTNRDTTIARKNPLKVWLDETGFPVEQLSPKRWAVVMSHGYLHSYYVEIVDHQEEWISFAAVLLGEPRGYNSSELYQFALELNKELNAAQIAIHNNRFVLVSNYPAEDSEKFRFYRNLKYFHQTHEYVYGRLLDYAEELNVKLQPLS